MSDLDDNTDNDTVDDVSDTTEEEWTPPTRQEFEELLAKKSKADSEAASRKRWLRELGYDPKTGKKVDADTVDKVTDAGTEGSAVPERDIERRIAKAEQRATLRANTLITAVPEALTAAGLNSQHAKRAMKLLDLDSVVVESDGEIDGLEDQINELKADFPEFFKRSRMKDVADPATVGSGKKTAAESKNDEDWATALGKMVFRGTK